MDLSVVIVTHNVAPLVGDCLESLYRDCEGLAIEAFVVDSASSDATVEVVQERFPAVRIVRSPVNVGFSRGNNLALGSCRGRYVALLNPDTVVAPGGMRGLIAYLDRNPAVGAAGPMLRLGDGSIQVECARCLPRVGNLWQWLLLLDKLDWAVRRRKRPADGRGDPPPASLFDGLNLLAWPRARTCAVESICGACMVVRAEVVKAVGLLDEASPLYLDDIDYCRRILDAGWPIHYVAEASVKHLGGQSSGQLKRAGDLYAMQCHAIWLYLRKHEGRAAAAEFVAIVAFASLVRLAICLVALALVWGRRRAFWLRQRAMVSGLAKWALRRPRRAPRFGFASEEPPAAPPAAADESR